MTLQHNTFSTPVQAYMGGAAFAAPCSHINITHNQSAVNQATEAIKTALAALAPVVRPLDQHLVPDPDYGPGYTTSGTYLQVSGADGLDPEPPAPVGSLPVRVGDCPVPGGGLLVVVRIGWSGLGRPSL